MSLRAGELRESIVIESPTDTVNDYGEAIQTWSVFTTRRAAIDGVSVSELMSAQGPYTVATHNVRMRYVKGLKAEMRLIWTSRSPVRTLDIISVSERNNREEHVLVCKEQVT
jgi:SPP1 family predicted phage head-tail adaptor